MCEKVRRLGRGLYRLDSTLHGIKIQSESQALPDNFVHDQKQGMTSPVTSSEPLEIQFVFKLHWSIQNGKFQLCQSRNLYIVLCLSYHTPFSKHCNKRPTGRYTQFLKPFKPFYSRSRVTYNNNTELDSFFSPHALNPILTLCIMHSVRLQH